MPKGIYDQLQEHVNKHQVIGCAIANKNEVFIGFQHDDVEEACACFYYPQTEKKMGGSLRKWIS